MPTSLDLVTAIVALLQWGGMPLYVLIVQAAMRRIFSGKLLLDVIITMAVVAFVIITPLEILSLIPLGPQITPYALASIMGGIFAVPITRKVRARFDI